MGGRGTLSSNNFLYTDKNKIENALKKNKIVLVGRITNRNKAVVSAVAQELLKATEKHGLKVDALVISPKNKTKALFQYRVNAHGVTFLVIPRATLDRGFKGVKKDITKAHKGNYVVGKNIYESVLHELGHHAQNQLRRKFPDTYSRLVTDLYDLQKKSGAKHKVSHYAYSQTRDNKRKGTKGNMSDTIAESLVHIMQGTRSRGGSDSVNLIRTAFEGKNIIRSIPGTKKANTKKTPTTPSKPKEVVPKQNVGSTTPASSTKMKKYSAKDFISRYKKDRGLK